MLLYSLYDNEKNYFEFVKIFKVIFYDILNL